MDAKEVEEGAVAGRGGAEFVFYEADVAAG